MTDWEKELARIDKQLASISDEQLLASAEAPAARPAARPAGELRAAPPPPVDRRARLGLLGRVGLAVALSVAILFWPHGTACGVRLFGYLASVGVVTAVGILAAVASWRHRAPVAHGVSLVVVLWSLLLAAWVILPRTGFAAVEPAARATWLCP